MPAFRAGIKLALLVLWITLWYPPVRLAIALKRFDWRDKLVCRCEQGLLRIIDVHLDVQGTPTGIRPLMLVSNHISYLDIYVLGSQMPLCFTPKSEIAGWPVIGTLAWLCGSIFIDRRTEKIKDMTHALKQALAENRVICLFPESTTGNGRHLLPFKSGFFSLADTLIDGKPLTVQPVSIRYQSVHNLPLDAAQWADIAWYGDMELAPHAWNLLKLGPIRARVTFLPPQTLEAAGNRKILASECHRLIETSLQNRPAH